MYVSPALNMRQFRNQFRAAFMAFDFDFASQKNPEFVGLFVCSSVVMKVGRRYRRCNSLADAEEA